MFEKYFDYFNWRSTTLMTGRYADLMRHYQVPIDIDLKGHTLAITHQDELELQLHRFRQALVAKGVVRLVPKITAVEMPRDIQRVWVNWQEILANGYHGETGAAVYSVSQRNNLMQVVAMTHTTLLVPEFNKASFRQRLGLSRAQG